MTFFITIGLKQGEMLPILPQQFYQYHEIYIVMYILPAETSVVIFVCPYMPNFDQCIFISQSEWPMSRSAGSDAMSATMRAKHGTAMRCDFPVPAMRILAAKSLCEALPRCVNTSDAKPRCRPLG